MCYLLRPVLSETNSEDCANANDIKMLTCLFCFSFIHVPDRTDTYAWFLLVYTLYAGVVSTGRSGRKWDGPAKSARGLG